MEERYQTYLNSYGLSEEPKTFEEFVKSEIELAERVSEQQNAINEIMPEIAPLYTITKTPESRTEAQQMLRTLQSMSQTMTAKESNKNVVLAHLEAFKAAKRIILNSLTVKTEKTSMTSTNVYDNDNRPTSY